MLTHQCLEAQVRVGSRARRITVVCLIVLLTAVGSLVGAIVPGDRGRAAEEFPPNSGFVPMTPARLLETRVGAGLTTVDGRFEGIGSIEAGATIELPVSGRGGVPAEARGVMLNVTAVWPTAPGFIIVYPCDEPRPLASNLNYQPGDIIPNAVLAKPDGNGTVCLYSLADTHIVVDVNGYTAERPREQGGGFLPGYFLQSVTPTRLLESRAGAGLTTVDGQFEGIGPIEAGATIKLPVTGRRQYLRANGGSTRRRHGSDVERHRRHPGRIRLPHRVSMWRAASAGIESQLSAR